MKAKMKKWLSLLLALALVVSGITVSQITPVYAEDPEYSTFTLYYYTEDADADASLFIHIWKGNWFKFAGTEGTQDYFDWGEQAPLQAVEGYENWFSIDLKLESSEWDDGIAIYNTNKTDQPLWKCGEWYEGTEKKSHDDYPTLVSGRYEAYAVKKGEDGTFSFYTDLEKAGLNLSDSSSDVFTLYYYTTDTTDDDKLYLDFWNDTTGLEFVNPTVKVADLWNKDVGELKPVDGIADLYFIELKIGTNTNDNKGFIIYKNGSSGKIYEVMGDDYTTLVSGTSKTYVIKNGTLYTKLSDAMKALTKDDLRALIDTVPSEEELDNLKSTDATALQALKDKLNAAIDCIKKDDAEPEEIDNCYKELEKAISEPLIKDDDIFVDKIKTISENDIRGMDVSSYISIMDSFDELNKSRSEADQLGFRDADGNLLDRQGFFNLLAENGVNYIRLRVWNDPYDATKKGYGGGNNDLDKAIKMGQYATNAGMKVLIDFHFSDFWADPSKQQEPKAWKGYTVDKKAEEIATYTENSLKALIDAGVDVGMVQIGNETNGKFCGEDNWTNMNRLFAAGCNAVHNVKGLHEEKILAVLHFTDPQKGSQQKEWAKQLSAGSVDYDVFATSYYPVWHGTLKNLQEVLSSISQDYGKYVMVAETSWANTLEDADGHENTVRRGNNDTKLEGKETSWTFSEQGQVREFRDVLDTVLSIDGGLGAFWWEGAWVPVQNAYDADGSLKESVVEQNKGLWEKYGSGWASSYANEYDPKDAGKWYGGSAVDNQGFFDANAKLLSSIKVYNYNYLKYGTTTEKREPAEAETQSATVVVGDKIPALPKTVKIIYNDDHSEDQSVTWNAEELADVQKKAESVKNLGTYIISGKTEKNIPVFYMITIEPKNEFLKNPGFEDSKISESTETTRDDTWHFTGSGYDFKKDDMKNSRSGKMYLHFWAENAFTFTASQTVSVEQAGVYGAGYYAQGKNAKVKLSVSVNTVSGNAVSGGTVQETEEIELAGWQNWVNPKLEEIAITKDQMKDGKAYITVTATVVGEAKAWGSLDDFYLYLLSEDIEEEPVKSDPPKEDPPVQNPPKEDPPAQNPPQQELKPANKGTVLNSATGSYKVTASADGAAEVAFTKVKNKKATKVTVPATIKDQNGVTYKVTSIAANTFKNNKKIKTVKLGSNIKSIGKNAFKGCTKLNKVTLDKNLEKIESSAFAGCTKLSSITVSAKVKEIGGNAFAGCKNLKKLTIKSTNLKKVGKNALKNINKKAVIKVPAKKRSAYKKLLKNKGQAKTVKIK